MQRILWPANRVRVCPSGTKYKSVRRRVVESVIQSAAIYSFASISFGVTSFLSPNIGFPVCHSLFPPVIVSSPTSRSCCVVALECSHQIPRARVSFSSSSLSGSTATRARQSRPRPTRCGISKKAARVGSPSARSRYTRLCTRRVASGRAGRSSRRCRRRSHLQQRNRRLLSRMCKILSTVTSVA